MRKRKCVVSFLLTIAMVFTLMPAAVFSASNDAESCAKLGILKGTDEAGVTDAYLAQSAQRYQTVVILARLMGLEDEIDNMPLDAPNFLDSAGKSEYVVKVMAFAKAHPELGFIGFDDGTFKPEDTITAQQIYKVLLVALGYVENRDFTWGEVLNKAMASGMSQLRNMGAITNNHLATALIEALKAPMAVGSKLMAESLIDRSMIDGALAKELGLLDKPATGSTNPGQVDDGNKTTMKPGSGGGGGGNGSNVVDPPATPGYIYEPINITVAFGTQPGDIDLPKVISLTSNTDKTDVITAAAVWDTSGYKPYEAGVYNIPGKLSGDIELVTALTAKVTVSSALTYTVQPIEFTVPYNTAIQDAIEMLPTSVIAEVEGGSIVNLTVSDWACANYDPEPDVDTAFVFTGTVSGLPANVTAKPITAKVTVLSAENSASTPSAIILCASPQNVQRPTASTTIELTVMVLDQFGEEMDDVDTIVKLVDNSDLKITLTGETITIEAGSTAKTIKVEAVVDSNDSITTDIIINISEEPIVATTMAWITSVTSMTPGSEFEFEAEARDQFGASMFEEEVTYKLKTAVVGVSIVGGEVTLTNDVAGGTKFTVVASCGELTLENEVTVNKAKSEVKTVVVNGDANITIPKTGTITKNYTAAVKDQYETEMSGVTVVWSVDKLDGVSISQNGVLSIQSTVTECTITVTAKVDEIEGSKEVAIADEPEEPAEPAGLVITCGAVAKVTLPAILPGKGGDDETLQFIVTDADGKAVTGAVWSVTSTSIEAGVSISEGGLLTVTSKAAIGFVTVSAVSGDAKGELEVEIVPAELELTMIEVTGPAIITKGALEYTYTAICYDQYGDVIEESNYGEFEIAIAIAWSYAVDEGTSWIDVDENYKGELISVDEVTNNLKIDAAKLSEETSISIKAAVAVGEIAGELTIEIDTDD